MWLSRHLSSFRGRLALLVTIAILPALIISVYSSFRLREQTASHARVEVELLAKGAAAQLGVAGHEADELLRYVQLTFRNAKLTPADCQRQLKALLDLHDQFANISIVDSKGRLRCSGRPLPAVAAASSARMSTFGGGPDSRSWRKHATVEDDVFVFSAPLHTPRLVNGLYLRAWVRASWFEDLIKSFSLPTGYTIFVLDANKHVLAAADGDEPFIGKEIALDCGEDGAKCVRESGVLASRGLDGRQRLFAYANVGKLPEGDGIRVFVGMPESRLIEEQRTELLHDLSALALAAALFFIIAWAGTSRMFLRPLDALARTARKLGTGVLGVRVSMPDIGELAVLGHSFNEMADQIEERSLQADAQLQRIKQLLRAYKVISAINDAILRNSDRYELAQEACRIFVDQGQFPMAWIGLLERDSGRVRPIAHAGGDPELIDRLEIGIAGDIPEGLGSIGVALRTGAPSIVRDIRDSQNMAPLLDAMLANGCLSHGTFPLTAAARPLGNLTICAREVDAFTTEDIELFSRTAADIGFAITRMEIEDELDKALKFDVITGLPNRFLFKDRLAHDIAHAKRGDAAVAVLLMQVREFERIVDAEGHHHADATLRAITRYLREQTRAEDSLAMIGHDVFALEIVESSDEEVFRSCTRLVSLFPKSVHVLGKWTRVSMRAGASYFPHDGADAEDLLRNAEFALHSGAEDEIGPYVFYSKASDERAHRRFALERALHKALDNNELSLAYQPVFDIHTRMIVGVEALARWDSPEFGSVSPAEFIPIAERAGLIEAIGLWVLRSGCAQAREWKEALGESPCVAMNVSLIQLHRPEFLEDVRRVLRATGIDPRALPLTIEITESETSYHMEETISILEEMREMGFKVYVDDFGTGYSSLSYLKRLPIDVLKVDRVFVKDLGSADSDAGFVKLLVDLARSLDLKIVAEGVETEEQFRILEELGCDMVQGFLLGRPMSAERVAVLFREAGVVGNSAQKSPGVV